MFNNVEVRPTEKDGGVAAFSDPFASLKFVADFPIQ